VFKLEFPFFFDKEALLKQKIYLDIELPVFVILDKDNKILYCWKAEPEKILDSKKLLERYL